jgi:hypothetical protein
VALVPPHLLGFLGSNPSAGNSMNLSRLFCETLSHGVMEYPKPCSRVEGGNKTQATARL